MPRSCKDVSVRVGLRVTGLSRVVLLESAGRHACPRGPWDVGTVRGAGRTPVRPRGPVASTETGSSGPHH